MQKKLKIKDLKVSSFVTTTKETTKVGGLYTPVPVGLSNGTVTICCTIPGWNCMTTPCT